MLYSAIERNKKPIGALEIPDDFEKIYLNRKDRQMRFCNAKTLSITYSQQLRNDH